MMIFGHLGIAVGVVRVLEVATHQLGSLDFYIDYRVIAIGALLPDLIDKPIAFFVFNKSIERTQTLAHKYWFSLLMVMLGGVLYGLTNHATLIGLGMMCMLHQMLDSFNRRNKKGKSDYFSSRIVRSMLRRGIPDKYVVRMFYERTYTSRVISYLFTPYILITEVVGMMIGVLVILSFHINI